MSVPATQQPLLLQVPFILRLGIALETSEYTIIYANQGAELGAAGQLVDTIEIAFLIPGRDGTFTVRIPLTAGAASSVPGAIQAKAAVVAALYAL